MELPGLILLESEDRARIDRLALMMGASFMEEPWTRTLLAPLDADESVLLAASQAIMKAGLEASAGSKRAYALEDESACAIAYLSSELGELDNAWFEEAAMERADLGMLSPRDRSALRDRMLDMEKISDFNWEKNESRGGDFIHLADLGVDARSRGTGSFRRLMQPFFDYADEAGIPCYLETFGDDLESLYRHMGFTTIRIIEDERFPLVERCMMRPAEKTRV